MAFSPWGDAEGRGGNKKREDLHEGLATNLRYFATLVTQL
jgi:hypothetical protein